MRGRKQMSLLTSKMGRKGDGKQEAGQPHLSPTSGSDGANTSGSYLHTYEGQTGSQE